MSYFSSPLKLSVIGQAAGLSAPYRMSALVGKTVYNSSAAATVLPFTLNLNTFNGKRFTSPENQGIVTTLAGSGNEHYEDGTGQGASFNFQVGGPTIGVAVDPGSNLYVAQYEDNKIRKITPGGVVTTFAENIIGPTGVAVDADSNVYVASGTNGTIHKITNQGYMYTLAGADASLNYPQGLAVDPNFSQEDGRASRNVYVADTINNRICKVTNPGGVVTTLDNSFNSPSGVAIDANRNVFVADKGNQRICKITSGGVVTTLAGSGSFNQPYDVAVDAFGNVFVTDEQNHRIRKVTNPGGVVTTLAGSGTSAFADGTGVGASFIYPKGVAVDTAGVVYVADAGNYRIRKIS